MSIIKINSAQPKRSFKLTQQKEPLSRLWFLSRGYKKADPCHTNGKVIWLHPKTNDVLSKFGTKIALTEVPDERHKKNTTRYLKMPGNYGNMYLARLKYLTFIGPIPEGCVIDHIDGNTFNNATDNLRAVPRTINDRDGGFMRKMRNNGYPVHMFCKVAILAGYKRMAKWKVSHTKWQYDQLNGKALLQVFIGPNYKVEDPDTIMDRDFTHHREF